MVYVVDVEEAETTVKYTHADVCEAATKFTAVKAAIIRKLSVHLKHFDKGLSGGIFKVTWLPFRVSGILDNYSYWSLLMAARRCKCAKSSLFLLLVYAHSC